MRHIKTSICWTWSFAAWFLLIGVPEAQLISTMAGDGTAAFTGDGLTAIPYEMSSQAVNSGDYHYSGMYSTPREVYVPACVFGANGMAKVISINISQQ